MRLASFFIIIIISCSMAAFAQNSGDGSPQKQQQIIEYSLRPLIPASSLQTSLNSTAKTYKLSVAQLANPDSLKKIIRQHTSKQPALSNKKFTPPGKTTNDPCVDTSFIRLFSNYTNLLYVKKMTSTADGGMLITGYLTSNDLLDVNKPIYGLLIKVTDAGIISWVKQFDNQNGTTYKTVILNNAFELSNTDIICTGSMDSTQGTGQHHDLIVYRLTKDGTIIWHSDMINKLKKLTAGVMETDIKGVAEGMNNDIILCGTTIGYTSQEYFETIIRLDKTGKIVWDANYGNLGTNHPGAEGMAVFYQRGQLTEVGISHGNLATATSGAVHFSTIDYATGNMLTKRFFKPSYADKTTLLSKNIAQGYNECTKLANGNFLVYGKLYSDVLQTAKTYDHYGVMEFDGSFNLLNSYTITSSLKSSYMNNMLYFDKAGKGLISLFESTGSLSESLYVGAFQNQSFLNQRRIDYRNIGLPGNTGFRYTNDNGYVMAQSYLAGGTKGSIEFRKMHNSDPSSKCLGNAVSLMQFLPYTIIEDPAYSVLDANIANQFKSEKYKFIQNDTLNIKPLDPCKQVNTCDTLKIHGNPVICGNQPSATFTAYKNPLCGGIVQWNIDTTGLQKIVVKNDTTLQVFFNTNNYQGKLYATLPVGACAAPLTDSVLVSVIRSHAALNLGADTVLCNNINLTLHAGAGFTTYLWQDGSTDSLLTVTAAGKYYVAATDACGGNYSDTINVSSATVAFNIGKDTMRCNNDTLHLSAPAGFTNYKWQPVYNISSDTGRFVNVLPLADTFYTVSAQTAAGCVVNDTISIHVAASSPIHLGNDTSLCAGKSVTLNAGAGFSSYAWSNGAATQQVTVSQQGVYIVKGTAANTCSSYDTLQVKYIGALADFTLGKDTTLCQNTIYTYNFSIPNATYLWNDGSTTNTYKINKQGIYSLTVTQQGCNTADTVVINYKNNPIVALGNDTSLCADKTYLLVAGSNANPQVIYTWQDGSSGPGYLVDKAGNYFVTANLNGCFARDTVTVNYVARPQFTLGGDTTVCKNQTLVLQPSINVTVNYVWQDGSTQPAFNVKDTGLYVLKVSNVCGSFADSLLVTMGTCNLMLPTSFSPNDDGLNDVFRVRFPFATKQFRLTIFNRFGEKIFETSDMGKGWDGTYKGDKQPMGSYVWIIQMKNINGLQQDSKGVVTLIK